MLMLNEKLKQYLFFQKKVTKLNFQKRNKSKNYVTYTRQVENCQGDDIGTQSSLIF